MEPECHVLLCEVKYSLRVARASGKESRRGIQVQGEAKQEETLQWPEFYLWSLIGCRRVSQGMASEIKLR